MLLRCLLFSADEETVRPILPVLEDLDIEGEFCASGAEAAGKIGSGFFQLVIADWMDQPDAAHVLKTAQDQKAAQRPLALAIVEDDSRLPEALRGGANSVLVKPLRAQQVHDTLATACELLRSKQARPAPKAPAMPVEPRAQAIPVTAKSGHEFRLIPKAPQQPSAERNFRAGEFLQFSSGPAAQFDTESDIQNSLDRAAGSEVDALTELEPMAGSAANVREEREALTGWASLQARLTGPAAQAASAHADVPSSSGSRDSSEGGLLSFGEGVSNGAAVARAKIREQVPAKAPAGFEQEDAFPAETWRQGPDEEAGASAKQAPAAKRSGLIVMGVAAVILLALLAIPQTRLRLQVVLHRASLAGANWLNPKPTPLPQALTQHDSFGQGGEEYKLPQGENNPDATTDPSQIKIVPVVDPTVKPGNGGGQSTGEAPAEGAGSNPTPVAEPSGASDSNSGPATKIATPGSSTVTQAQGAAALSQPVSPITATPRIVTAGTISQRPQANTVASAGSIPSSLRSQTASMTPEVSGAKPAEAAMAAIEPVALPEAAVWTLLTQKADPQYPEAAKAGSQRGSVTLQVLIARDGTVQDAKFMQGSLIFARAAIDALKQWKFKPYLMNGRPVSVQSAITLSFKPPA
jgi:TonB family protein